MTPDVIGVLVAAATLVGGLFVGIAGLLSRQTVRLEARFDARFTQIDARLDRLEVDVNDLKVSVARLEGPLPRLVLPH